LLAYEAADLFILPTRDLECFGLIIVEALAMGCPVIASEVGAIPELLRPLAPEWLVPPGDVEKLRQKVTAFLDGSLAIPSGEALVDYAERRWNKQSVTQQIAGLLESCAIAGQASKKGEAAANGRMIAGNELRGSVPC